MAEGAGTVRVGRLLLPLLIGSLCAGAGCRQDTPPHAATADAEARATRPPAGAFFVDRTPGSGVDFTYRNGEEADHHSILESLGGGVALLDYDGDGLLDVFVTGGGTFTGPDKQTITGLPCKLYRNLGDWKFVDVTEQAGLGGITFYNHGCAVADYDRDGWPDLLVTGYGRLALYHNEPDGHGGRRFVEVTRQAGLDDALWCTSAAWADLDGDGFPDLYVCHYLDWSFANNPRCAGDTPAVERDVCPPKNFHGQPPVLYHNNGDGTFRDVTSSAGLRLDTDHANMALGVVAVDVDGDRRPDLYVVSDTTDNFLYLNQSSRGRVRLREAGLESGVARGGQGTPDGCMGVDAADYDGCGRPSLWVTTFENERHALYHNECQGGRVVFEYATRSAGIAALGPGYVGFGTGFLDLANEGWEDLVIANGHVRRHPTRCGLRQYAVLLHNLGGEGEKRFADISSQGGAYFQDPHRGRGLAVGDLDNDGRADLVISHVNEPVVLLRNDPQGENVPRNHWLGVELLGRGHRDTAGAKVVVEAGGRRLTRFAKGGGSYLSSGDRRLLFGLGRGESVERVTVFWPWGEEQHWDGLASDRYWRLAEGEPAARDASAGRPR